MPQLMVLKDDFSPALRKKLLGKYHKNVETYLWIFANEEELRKKYPDKYIAVEDKTVKFTGETIEEVILKIKSSDKQVDDFVIEFIRTHPINLLL